MASRNRSVPAADRVAKPQARTAAKRVKILEAAMTVFGTRGYNNAALAEIAEQAGMTHAGVLHHFGSKEGLLVAVLKYRDGEAMAGVAGREQVEGPAFLPHLTDTVRDNIKRPGVVQTYAVLSAESVTDGHPAQEYFRGRMAGLRIKLQRVIGMTTGREVEDDDVRDAASALIAVMDGLQVQWLLDPQAVDMPRTLALVLDELIERLATNEPAPPVSARVDGVLSVGAAQDEPQAS
ncbi:TetR/AcrR family transcriptional regulator [Microbacterium sp. STN6]|uniref:TetR/AcrR family transcriptional regulator n=1 Tax=Microbacterium sp. STN6 TaxID=2995588 RepID=UPI002260E286|nr:TetR/AcrR family transcriptional regulator [Microbacterium sp. STN6]MCX7522997.1 TetR/AcrR family transcriptional regulator [Microbacterium sp. STN6]